METITRTTTTLVRYPEIREAYRKARSAARPPISQERLAAAAGTTRRTIIRIENGQHRPRPELRDRLADVLGVDRSVLPAVEAVVPPFPTSEAGSTRG